MSKRSRSGSASSLKCDPVAAVVDAARRARPARGPSGRRPCPATRPLRALPRDRRRRYRAGRSASSPMWMSKPGRIGPFFVLGLSCGRRIRSTRSAVRLSIAKRVVEPRARRPVERRFRARSGTRPAGRDTATLRSFDLPNTDPSIRPIRNLRPELVSIRAIRSTMKRWPGAVSSRTSAAGEQQQQRDEQRQQFVEQPPRPVAAERPLALAARPARSASASRPSPRTPGRARRRPRPGRRPFRG